MSSPAVTSGTISSERYYSTWIRTWHLREGEDVQWDQTPVCLQKDRSLPLWYSWNLVDVTVWAALCLDVGPDRMPQSFSRHNFILFQVVPWKTIARHLPSNTLHEGPQTETSVSYQKNSSLKPVEGFLQQGTISPQSASTAILSLFSLQVYSPKHRGTEAQQLTEIKSDISTICLKMWDHWLISFI